MVLKLCVACGAYFKGELDGGYTCSNCLDKTPERARASSLEGLFYPLHDSMIAPPFGPRRSAA